MYAEQKEKLNVQIDILGKEYILTCRPHEREMLMRAGSYYDQFLREIREANPQIHHETMLILGSIQMAFKLLQELEYGEKESKYANNVISHLLHSLDQAIAHEQVAEALEDGRR